MELPLPGSSLAASLAQPFHLSPWDLAAVSGVAASRQDLAPPAALAQLKQRGVADHDAKVSGPAVLKAGAGCQAGLAGLLPAARPAC